VACEPWPAGAPERLAGVSAFGFGGTNAHAVLAEAPPALPRPAPPPGPPFLLALSARSTASLRALVGAHRAALARLSDEALYDWCAAAARRRTHFAQRAAVAGGSAAELAAELDRWLADPAAGAALAAGSAAGPVAAAAAAYCSAQAVDWTALFPVPPRPQALPRYAWDRVRCWRDE
jgi:acyl transferase domain-containing protein